MISKRLTIAANTFIESLRQPAFISILGAVSLLLALNPAISILTLGEDQKLLIDLGLSTILLGGLFLSAFTATASISAEIDNKTILAVLTKPVAKQVFISGKYLGVCAVISLACWIWTMVFLLGVRHGAISAAWDTADIPVISFGTIALGLALLVAAWGNYFRSWNFPTALSALLAVFLPLAWGMVLIVDKSWSLQPVSTEFTGEGKPTGQVLLALLLILQALWLLASVAIACSTRLRQLSTLLILFGVFLLGLSSDLSFAPNLQLHWMSDAISLEIPISPAYIAMVSAYTVLFIGAILCLASALFEGRETG